MRRNFFVIFISVVLLLSLFLCGCSGETVEPIQSDIEPPIPDNYLTYTDEAGIFNISYPPEWELLVDSIVIHEQFRKEYLLDIDENFNVEKSYTVFLAGLPFQNGHMPAVSVVVSSLNKGVNTIDEVYELNMATMKYFMKDFREVTKVKTIIDGREAIITHYQGRMPTLDTVAGNYLLMAFIADKNVWSVTCYTSTDYNKWEDDFNNIVRSLRILK